MRGIACPGWARPLKKNCNIKQRVVLYARGGDMDEFRMCPSCEYTRGFHAAFRKDPEGIRIVFICPECGASYDIGIVDSLVNDLKPKRGADY